MGVGEHVRLAAAIVFLGAAGFACGEDDFAFLDEQDDGADAAQERSRPEDFAATPSASAPPVRRAASPEERTAPPVADPGAVARAGDLRALDTVDDPVSTLAAADVRDRSGDVVGVVSAIRTLPSGAVEEIVIALADGETLRVTPPFARYDADTDSVTLVLGVNELTR